MASFFLHTRTSIDDELAAKADLVHTHTEYALVGHTHATLYAPLVHTHTGFAATSHTHSIADIQATGTRDDTRFLRGDGTWAIPPGTGGGGTGGVTDHGALTGLTDDDHPQYHTDARGDARYSRTTHTHTVDGITDATVTGKALVRATDAAAARAAIGATNLTLGTTAGTALAGNYVPPPAPVSSVAGKTGAVTLVKGDVGLGSVDNTADSAKPVSTAQNTAIQARADKSVTQAIVFHDGSTGGGTRPSGYVRVLWVNPVGTTYGRPTNMLAGDMWETDV